MQIHNLLDKPLISIVACLHGDEIFGKTIVDTFSQDQTWLPYVQFVFANEEAYQAKTRFLDQDLNRSFADNDRQNHEQKLAPDILAAVASSRFVLDIHTTTAAIGNMVPIVAHLDGDTRYVLNFCRSKSIAWIQPELVSKSLIGNVPAGVSLEFEHGYSQTQAAIDEVRELVNDLLSGVSKPELAREVYLVTRPIDKSLGLPADTQNFVYSDAVKGYPFLFGEKAYPNGLLAPEKMQSFI
jgi:hypothetical protein